MPTILSLGAATYVYLTLLRTEIEPPRDARLSTAVHTIALVRRAAFRPMSPSATSDRPRMSISLHRTGAFGPALPMQRVRSAKLCLRPALGETDHAELVMAAVACSVMRWRLGTPQPPACASRAGPPRSPSSSQIVWAIAPVGIGPTDQQLLDGFGRR